MDKIALIGNFPPRKCGIATFMNDLNDGIRHNGILTSVIAMNDEITKYDYPADVEFQIDQNDISSYINAADYLNDNHFKAAILQHEFGIFGGPDGKNIIQLMKRLQMPVITTFHTILDTPTEGQKFVMNEIVDHSNRLISISKKGIDILNKIYKTPVSKCKHIHHGVHKTAATNSAKLKQMLGIAKQKVLLTFGLLSRNKSIEVVINAFADVVKRHPDSVYIVLGATHPHVLKYEGESYRQSLINLVKELKLEKNVLFINRFVSNEELFEFLRMCDIYVIPYLGEKQISSGTLIYAMGAGKPIISTPFWYAQEMLADNRGILFDFNNVNQLSEKINYLFDNDSERKTISVNAFSLASQCYWQNIGKQYIDLVNAVEKETSRSHQQKETVNGINLQIPPLNLDQLRMLTDDTGILQHARYSVPNRIHGYCTDDNARALMLAVMLRNEIHDTRELKKLTSTYLSFIDYAWNPTNGKFRNFMSYEKQWLEEEGSEDSGGRTIWTLGYTAAYTGNKDFYRHSDYLFKQGLEHMDYICHPRALAYLILGLTSHAEVHGEAGIIDILKQKVQKLSAYFDNTINNDWLWFDSVVTYGNSRIPQALIAAGMYLKNDDLVARGLRILDWLIDKQFSGNTFSPIGNNGWLTPEKKALFDQQPLEAHGMIDACLQAEEYVADRKYANYALQAFSWFTGHNDCGLVLYDPTTGGCRDGLHPDGVNLNQGAESTLSWLMSLTRISRYLRDNNK